MHIFTVTDKDSVPVGPWKTHVSFDFGQCLNALTELYGPTDYISAPTHSPIPSARAYFNVMTKRLGVLQVWSIELEEI